MLPVDFHKDKNKMIELTTDDFTCNGLITALKEDLIYKVEGVNDKKQVLHAEIKLVNKRPQLHSMFFVGKCSFGPKCNNRDCCLAIFHEYPFHKLTPEEPICIRPRCKKNHPSYFTHDESQVIPGSNLYVYYPAPLFCSSFINCPNRDCTFLHLRVFTPIPCRFDRCDNDSCPYDHDSPKVVNPYQARNLIIPCEHIFHNDQRENCCDRIKLPKKIYFDDNEIPVPRSFYRLTEEQKVYWENKTIEERKALDNRPQANQPFADKPYVKKPYVKKPYVKNSCIDTPVDATITELETSPSPVLPNDPSNKKKAFVPKPGHQSKPWEKKKPYYPNNNKKTYTPKVQAVDTN